MSWRQQYAVLAAAKAAKAESTSNMPLQVQ